MLVTKDTIKNKDMELVKVKVMKKHYVNTDQKKAEAIIIMTKQIPKQKKKNYQQRRNFLKKIISVEICNKFKFVWIYMEKYANYKEM